MKYKEMKNLNELLVEVKRHGLATDCENICTVQDILGRSSVNELDVAAEGDFRSTLFHIVFAVWDYDRATGFYNNHNGVNENLRKKEKEILILKKDLNASQLNEKNLREQVDSLNGKSTELKSLKEQHEADQVEIMQLKAKLYDLMVSEKEVV